MLAKNPKDCIETAFAMFDVEKHQLIEKEEMYRIFCLLNSTVQSLGDKFLIELQLRDLVDSIYVSIGKIDGYLYYPDYFNNILDHPIIQVLISLQFQGPGVDKYVKFVAQYEEAKKTDEEKKNE